MLRSLCAVVVLLVSGRVVCAAVSLCPCRISIVPPLLDRFGLFCVLRCFELCALLCCGKRSESEGREPEESEERDGKVESSRVGFAGAEEVRGRGQARLVHCVARSVPWLELTAPLAG